MALLYAAPASIRKRTIERSYVPPAGLDEARASFRSFLSQWVFTQREGRGRQILGSDLWPGQSYCVDLIDLHHVRRLIDLKAGKIGHSEVWTAYSAWRGLFSAAGSRVHMFSQTGDDAKTLLDIVRVGVNYLPKDWGFRTAGDVRWGDTSRSLFVRGPDGEMRQFWSYAPRGTASISDSAVHVHVDELAHMQRGKEVYNSAVTTIPDDGTLVVLSRGHGVGNHMADLWEQVVGDDLSMEAYLAAHAAALRRVETDPHTMVPLFQDYSARTGRDATWREQQGETMTLAGLRWFAPETPEDAFAGDEDEVFVPVEMWDQLEVLGPIPEGDRTAVVLALDAGVRDDYTALVGVTRHPERHEEVAVRFVYEWRPNGAVLDFAAVRDTWRMLRERYNVVCTVYDPYALEEMAQDLGREAYWERFDQGSRRLLADKGLKDAITQRRMARPPNGSTENDILRRAINAAGAKTGQEEDKLRIVKRAAGKIDPAVALSMCRSMALDLNL